MKHTILSLLLLCGVLNAFSQVSIDDQLLKNADLVILDAQYDFVVESKEKAKLHFKKKIWVKNKEGMDKATMVAFYDKSSSISNMKGSLFEPGYKKPKKFKESEIVDVLANVSAGYIDDNRLKVIQPTISKYPAIIEYSYTQTFNGLFLYPKWTPISNYNESVVSSSYTIKLPKDFKFRLKETNINSHTKSESDGMYVYEWKVDNYKAIKEEEKSIPVIDFAPFVSLQPYQFFYEKTEGDLSTWKSFGEYIVGLNKGTRDLPEEVIAEIKKLTAGASSDLEKAQIVYEYMQGKTRYVSIQLGIGGLKPFNTNIVHEKGYGDCKGLSNYTYNLLKAVDLDPRYVIIEGGRGYSNLDEEMVSSQFNHAILCIPNLVDSDTVWLECTSQTTPFGYMGPFTGNRKALVIEEGNSKIVDTKQYTASDNIQSRHTIVKLKQNNKVWLQSHIESRGFQYENMERLARESEKDLRKLFLERYALKSSEIETIDVQNKKVYPDPVSIMDFTIEVGHYGKSINEGVMFSIFPFKDDYDVPKRYRSRKTDFVIDFPYTDVDTVDIYLLEGMKLEELPKGVSILSEFGEYNTSLKNTETPNMLQYIRSLKLIGGVFSKEKYTDYYNFMKEVNSSDEEKLWVGYNPNYSQEKEVE